MSHLIESILKVFTAISAFLNQFGNWYTTLFIFAFFYKVVLEQLIRIIQKGEMKKRKLVTAEIEEIKQRYGLKDKFFYSEESEEMEKMRGETKAAIKKHHPKMYLIIGPFLIQFIIFFLLLVYFFTLKEIDKTIYLPYVCAIITFFTNLTRKTIWFRLAIAVIICLLLLKTSGAMQYFYLFYDVLAIAKIWLNKIKRKEKIK